MRGLSDLPTAPAARGWLIRIPEVFSALTPEILESMGIEKTMPLGPEYHLLPGQGFLPALPLAPFIRWHLPVHHSWPCHPRKMVGFVEKAAQAIRGKFAGHHPQTIQAGPLTAGAPGDYYKGLASNLRGRLLQLFPGLPVPPHDAEAQERDAPTLFVLTGETGLFCGLQSPRVSMGFHPGGTRYISQAGEETISRAGAKLAGALHHLLLHQPAPPSGSHWLELGASPGGMTAELLRRGYRVTAVDRAPLDQRLAGRAGLIFAREDVAMFQPPPARKYQALLCDMNGDAQRSLQHVIRLSRYLEPGGLVVFTLKLPNAESFTEINTVTALIRKSAEMAGLEFISGAHLPYNRQEFTMIWRKTEPHTGGIKVEKG